MLGLQEANVFPVVSYRENGGGKTVMTAPTLSYALLLPKTVCLTPHPFLPTLFPILPLLRGVCTDKGQVGRTTPWTALRKIHPFSLVPPLQPWIPHSPPSPPPAVLCWGCVSVLLRWEGGYKKRMTDIPFSPFCLTFLSSSARVGLCKK